MKHVRNILARGASAVALGALLHGCHGAGPSADAGPPRRSCVSTLWAQPASAAAAVGVRGAWDGFVATAALHDYGTSGWKVIQLTLPPGEYGYQLVDAGATRLDPYQPLTTFHGDVEVSLLRVPDCQTPALSIPSVDTDEGGTTRVRASFLAAADGEPVSPDSVTVDVAGARVAVDAQAGVIDVVVPPAPRGKRVVTLRAADGRGRSASARATLWSKPAHDAFESGLLYQIVTDRFRGDGGAALEPPPTPGSRAGGTLDGVRAELERGTFDELGVTAIWLSPVYTNPDGALPGSDGHLYEGYHGYWPLQSRQVDPRLGGEAALHAVVESAHARGIRVLLDIVPNHVYEKNPRYLSPPSAGMFHTGSDDCVCGSPGCDWGTHILSCWFASYLPDVRYESDDAMRLAVEDAAWFHDTFDIDGVRIDAVPMMPRATTRRIVDELRTSMAPRQARFTLGEVYTGPGTAGLDQIKYQLGPSGLDAAFDFPLMWALRDAVATGTAGFDVVESLLVAEETSLRGSGSILARILGNHDTTRFASESLGDAALDPWTAPAPTTIPDAVYARQLLGLTFALTVPGLPVVYYGDEVALTGGGDPGSRRVMPDLATLSPAATRLRAAVAALGRLRACEPALRSGDRTSIAATATTTSFVRKKEGSSPVLVLLSVEPAPTPVFVGGAVPAGAYVDVLGGDRVDLAGDPAATVLVPALSARVLVPAGDACLFP